MKNYKFPIYAFFLSCCISHAQEKMNLGFSAAPNLTFAKDLTYSANACIPSVGYTGAISFQVNFSKISSVHIEALYENKRINVKNTFTDIGGEREEISFHRISIPVLYRANLKNLFLDGGPYLGYAINDTYSYSLTVSSSSGPSSGTSTRNYSSHLYFGVATGIGYNVINRKKISLFMELRNNLDLTSKDSFNKSNSYHLDTINLLCGVAFKF